MTKQEWIEQLVKEMLQKSALLATKPSLIGRRPSPLMEATIEIRRQVRESKIVGNSQCSSKF